MFSLKTVLFATTALAGFASAAPLLGGWAVVHTDAKVHARSPLVDAVVDADVAGLIHADAYIHARSPRVYAAVHTPVGGARLITERDACDSCGSIPGVFAHVNVQLDGILAAVRKCHSLDLYHSPTDLSDVNARCHR